MRQRRWFMVFTCLALALPFAAVCPAATPAPMPEGTLTAAVAAFGNERWLPQLNVGAEDVVLLGGQWPTKPTYDAAVPWALPDAAVPWALPDAERARKARLALNLAGEWPLIPGHMGFQNWEYVTRAR